MNESYSEGIVKNVRIVRYKLNFEIHNGHNYRSECELEADCKKGSGFMWAKLLEMTRICFELNDKIFFFFLFIQNKINSI